MALATVTAISPSRAVGTKAGGRARTRTIRTPPGVLPSGAQVRQAARAARKRLQRQRAELARERKRLEELRREIDKHVAELQQKLQHHDAPAPQAQPSDPLAGPEGRKRLQQMAKGLSRMSPQQAAQTLANLPRELAVRLLLEMDDRKAGKLLGALPPEKAAVLVTGVLRRTDRNPQAGKKDK